jgi:hypothetical protein
MRSYSDASNAFWQIAFLFLVSVKSTLIHSSIICIKVEGHNDFSNVKKYVKITFLFNACQIVIEWLFFPHAIIHIFFQTTTCSSPIPSRPPVRFFAFRNRTGDQGRGRWQSCHADVLRATAENDDATPR